MKTLLPSLFTFGFGWQVARIWVSPPPAALGMQIWVFGAQGREAPPGAMQVHSISGFFLHSSFSSLGESGVGGCPGAGPMSPQALVFLGLFGGAMCQAPLRMPEPGSHTNY